jgi:deazaflavin-dependent oxidoreductase (nitroreductase family)
MSGSFDELASVQYAYVTTTGRVTGQPHEIEIWFGVHAGVLYLMSGGGERSDWVKNLRANPALDIRIADQHFKATARFVGDAEEEALARRLLAAKYEGWEEGQTMTEWALSALPVAIEVVEK